MKGKNGSDEIVEITIPSDTRHLHMMRVLTGTLAESMGFARADSENAALAVEEALTNVIEHAYHGEKTHRMHVVYEMKGDCFRVRIVHNGDQLGESDITMAEDLSSYYQQKKKGGLGIVLMKKCMDEVTYRSGRRNKECCMVKYLHKQAQNSA
jgi:serine/threonine-protein kinase RsbW